MIMRIACIILLSILLVGLFVTRPTQAIEPLVFNPQPFRGDEFEGRQFWLGKYSFLHRISYRPRAELLTNWRNGFIGSIGSITGHEFYSLMNLQKNISFSESLEFELRSERGEDFDSRFDRTQIGLGYHFNSNWSLSALSGLAANKENEDLQLELIYKDHQNSFLRIALVVTDLFFNEKQREHKEYSKQPYTFFIQTHQQISNSTLFEGYINYNSPLTLEYSDQNLTFDYENLSAALSLKYQTENSWWWRTQFNMERGERARYDNSEIGSFDRDYDSFALKFHFNNAPGYPYWVALRLIDFKESDDRFLSTDESSELSRQEIILSGGMEIKLTDTIIFSPVLFIDKIDNYHHFSQRSIEHDQTLVKLNLPFEFHFDNEAILVLNVTFELDQEEFGGLNLQLIVPF